jgi:hypothetical protein
MGATSFADYSYGNNMSEAYDNACEDAREEYGHQQGYNGTISTTSGFRDVTSEFKRSKLSLDKFIDKNLDRAEKWGRCLAICIKEPKKNTNKIKSIVKHIVFKGTRKWETRYVVHTYGYPSGKEIGHSTKKGEAVKIARRHTEKTREGTYIEIRKVLLTGKSTVAEISYKKGKESQGKYIFFGWAAC